MAIAKKDKLSAVISATQAKFGLAVESLEKELRDFALSWYLNNEENMKAAQWYSSVPEQYKCCVNLCSLGSLWYETDKYDKGQPKTRKLCKFDVFVRPCVELNGEYERPFNPNNYNTEKFTFGYPIVVITTPTITGQKARNLVKKRMALHVEIKEFMKDLHAALIPMTSRKKIEDGLPTIVPFFNFPSKGTSMVDKHLMDKVNAQMANV